MKFHLNQTNSVFWGWPGTNHCQVPNLDVKLLNIEKLNLFGFVYKIILSQKNWNPYNCISKH